MSSFLGIGRPSPESASLAATPKAASRHPRQSSQAAYSIFDAAQIQTFREAFQLLDSDSDGFISAADLSSILTSMGLPPNTSQYTPIDINFTTFLTQMAEKLSLLDVESDLVEAFACFDEHDQGVIPAKDLRKCLGDLGDRMTPEEIARLLSPPFLDKHDMFHYRTFCETLRVTEIDEGAA